MLGDLDACLHICLDKIQRKVAIGQAPESGDIRIMGRCFIRLGRLDDLKKHEQQFPNEDWGQLQDDEENRMKGDGDSRMAN
jgi:hypothetical protein